MTIVNEKLNKIINDTQWLDQLIPLNELQPADRQKLVKNSQIIDLRLGDKFNSSAQHNWLVYLYSGHLELIKENIVSLILKANTKRALHPVFSEKEHHMSVVAEQPSILAKFDRQLFNALMDEALLSGEELETIEVSEAEGPLFNTIMHAFNQGDLALPSLPEIALKVKEAVSNPDVTTDQLVRILEADPAIVARLIKVANSPINKGLSAVNSIRAAVIRLGLASTRDLVLCLAVKQLFKAESSLLVQRMQQLYEHSIEVAAIAYTLAKKTTHLAADEMLLAGLVHDIGIIPILTYIDKTGFEIDSFEQIEDIISDLRSVVGSMVISNWGLSSNLISVVENAENWNREGGDNADMCDVILAAQIYCRLQHHQLSDIPAFDKVPAFRKLFPNHNNPELIKEILEQAEEEVEEVKRLLKM